MSTNYSAGNPKVLSGQRRIKVAKQMTKLIKEHIVGSNQNMRVLDIGCSSGIISEYLASRFGRVVGIDIDKDALKLASKIKKSNLTLYYMNAEKMKFKDNSFDIVILSQVHYYFKNQKKLFSEIYRVLKPEGIVFLSGTNKYRLIKPFEPILTYYKSFWELKSLLSKFKIHPQTKEVIGSKFKLFNLVPRVMFDLLEPLTPNFIWILKAKE